MNNTELDEIRVQLEKEGYETYALNPNGDKSVTFTEIINSKVFGAEFIYDTGEEYCSAFKKFNELVDEKRKEEDKI